jgi:predicted thioesterase
MKDVPAGLANRVEIMPEERHTAAALGNTGVHVVSTPSLIGYLEMASHRSILPYCEEGEASVGTRVEVDHLAPAFLGQPIIATARVLATEGRRITFEVAAEQGGRLIMKGRHGRAVIRLDRLLDRAPKTGP